ncbi:MAG TPA: hypothetical protein VKG23_10325 [Thermoanaerobaculia bacterium]|jgi:hypothetical protein|nr:hypothetical protein [Thermoanaerobaculia bacterium]
MTRVDTISDAAFPRRGCANEGCVRRPEPGEDYCSVCCLEWSLFRRDERRLESAERAVHGREAARR